MKTLALAVCLVATVAALSACEATTHSAESTTSGNRVLEKGVTK